MNNTIILIYESEKILEVRINTDLIFTKACYRIPEEIKNELVCQRENDLKKTEKIGILTNSNERNKKELEILKNSEIYIGLIELYLEKKAVIFVGRVPFYVLNINFEEENNSRIKIMLSIEKNRTFENKFIIRPSDFLEKKFLIKKEI